MTADPLPEVVELGHLTAVLRLAGVLGDAMVRRVTVISARPTVLSRIIRIRLEYDGNADGAPTTLILKMGLPDRDPTWGRREVGFYETVAAATPGCLVPRCFDSGGNANVGGWHLLLEDLTDTHTVPTTWPLPPSLAQCEMILRARARFHAAWWEDPRLGTSIGKRPDTEDAASYAKDSAVLFERFVNRLGDALTRERRAIYERFIAAVPELLGRRWSKCPVTITHGDAHVWNAFLPRDGGDDVRLFDWDSWRVNLASGDLAYMMAVHWYPDHRRRFEKPLLDFYHVVLLENGVPDYSRNDLDDDYRLSVLSHIMTPVRQAAHNIPTGIWWNHFERIMLAIGDLGCLELI